MVNMYLTACRGVVSKARLGEQRHKHLTKLLSDSNAEETDLRMIVRRLSSWLELTSYGACALEVLKAHKRKRITKNDGSFRESNIAVTVFTEGKKKQFLPIGEVSELINSLVSVGILKSLVQSLIVQNITLGFCFK